MSSKNKIFIQIVLLAILFYFFCFFLEIFFAKSDVIIIMVSCVFSILITIMLRLKETTTKYLSDISKETRQQKFVTEIAKLGIDSALSWTSFSISPDAACYLINKVRTKKPLVVIECGSGDSTVIIASGLKKNGKGKIISFEHDKLWAKKSKSMIKNLSLQDYCEVVYAPLEQITVDKGNWLWYSNFENKIKDEKIDMLFIDGPPKKKDSDSPRYPAVPICLSRFNDGAIVILDDAKRTAEKDYIYNWKKKYNLTGDIRLQYERGLGVLKFEK